MNKVLTAEQRSKLEKYHFDILNNKITNEELYKKIKSVLEYWTPIRMNTYMGTSMYDLELEDPIPGLDCWESYMMTSCTGL